MKRFICEIKVKMVEMDMRTLEEQSHDTTVAKFFSVGERVMNSLTKQIEEQHDITLCELSAKSVGNETVLKVKSQGISILREGDKYNQHIGCQIALGRAMEPVFNRDDYEWRGLHDNLKAKFDKKGNLLPKVEDNALKAISKGQQALAQLVSKIKEKGE